MRGYQMEWFCYHGELVEMVCMLRRDSIISLLLITTNWLYTRNRLLSRAVKDEEVIVTKLGTGFFSGGKGKWGAVKFTLEGGSSHWKWDIQYRGVIPPPPVYLQ